MRRAYKSRSLLLIVFGMRCIWWVLNKPRPFLLYIGFLCACHQGFDRFLPVLLPLMIIWWWWNSLLAFLICLSWGEKPMALKITAIDSLAYLARKESIFDELKFLYKKKLETCVYSCLWAMPQFHAVLSFQTFQLFFEWNFKQSIFSLKLLPF